MVHVPPHDLRPWQAHTQLYGTIAIMPIIIYTLCTSFTCNMVMIVRKYSVNFYIKSYNCAGRLIILMLKLLQTGSSCQQLHKHILISVCFTKFGKIASALHYAGCGSIPFSGTHIKCGKIFGFSRH